MKTGLKTIFMGTPDFSVPTLKRLSESRHDVKLVITQPDRPKGRGRKAVPPPVKTAALELACAVFQPEAVRTEAPATVISDFDPDIYVVIAYGHILPETLLNIPRYGAINAHASLLPKYRGSAPIQWAIIGGEKETGVTTIQMDKGMDTGDILLSSAVPIGDEDTADTMHDKLAQLAASVTMETLDRIMDGTIHPVRQQHELATFAPLLKKSDGHINWELPAAAIQRFIRGVTPWPGAYTYHDGKRLKIFASEMLLSDTNEEPGTILQGFPDELRIATGNRALSILEIQGDSGKRLPINAYLRGRPMAPGSRLT